AGTELPGDRPGEADQAGLRGRVVRLTGHSVEARDRGDEDDAALLRPDHHGDGALDSAEGTGEVRIDDGFELLIVHAHEQIVGGDAGIGHDDLDGPQLLLDLGEGPVDGCGVGDI